MKYETTEKSYIDSNSNEHALIGAIHITGLNANQFNEIRGLVVRLHKEESRRLQESMNHDAPRDRDAGKV